MTELAAKMRNEGTIHRVYVQINMSQRVDENFLRWVGYVEQMGEQRLTSRVYHSNLEVKGRKEADLLLVAWKETK